MGSPLDRPAERRRLDEILAAPGPSLTLVDGPVGTGKSRLLRSRCAHGSPATVSYLALPLPDPDHRALLARRLEGWSASPGAVSRDADWPELLDSVVAEVAGGRRRLVLALDDAHLLAESRRQLPELLAAFWADVRARSLPVHLLLAGPSPHLLRAFGEEDGPLASYVTDRLTLEPLDYRAVAELVPEYDALDRLRCYGAFGGLTSRLRHLDPSVTLGTNVRRALLEPDAPLVREGLRVLGRDLSSTARYSSILRAVTEGAHDWGSMVDAVRDVDSGGTLAPYVARLEELGHMEVERSLDAGPRSRRRRYHVGDPFLAFWHRAILPRASELAVGRSRELWGSGVRHDLERHMAQLFPRLCRQYLDGHAEKRLGAEAREVGGLWGAGYDLDPSGTLRNGVVCYGRAVWSEEAVGEGSVEAVESQLRHTRYGFGKEARLRLLFSARGFEPAVRRRAARDHLVEAFDVDDLLASG